MLLRLLLEPTNSENTDFTDTTHVNDVTNLNSESQSLLPRMNLPGAPTAAIRAQRGGGGKFGGHGELFSGTSSGDVTPARVLWQRTRATRRNRRNSQPDETADAPHFLKRGQWGPCHSTNRRYARKIFQNKNRPHPHPKPQRVANVKLALANPTLPQPSASAVCTTAAPSKRTPKQQQATRRPSMTPAKSSLFLSPLAKQAQRATISSSTIATRNCRQKF